MALAVVGYPNISQDDYDWIQEIRINHDAYHQLIAPHFTFVFPCNTEQTVLIEHIQKQTEYANKISFIVRCAVVVKDTYGDMTHVFLIPDEGFSDIVKLHDKLYTGVLASEHRLDIPFIPHIGIANSTDPHICKQLADDLNSKKFAIEGTVGILDIVSIDRDRNETTTINQIELT